VRIIRANAAVGEDQVRRLSQMNWKTVLSAGKELFWQHRAFADHIVEVVGLVSKTHISLDLWV